ncbi:MAG: hypothetical protein ACK41T_00350 [Pseudobdellovibrio sp.]
MKFFLLIIFFINKLYAYNVKTRFQVDLYKQKNECGVATQSVIPVIQVSFDLDVKSIKKNMILQVRDEKTKFFQNIIYKEDYFLYPELFSQDGHKEYGEPDCDKDGKRCRFFVFIFDPEYKLSKSKKILMNFDILYPEGNIKNIKMNIKEKNIFYLNNKSKLEDINELFYKIDLIMNKNETYAILDKKKIKELLDKKYKIKMIFAYRLTIDQQAYTEESSYLNREHSWVSEASDRWMMSKKVYNPTYMSFMVIVSKENKVYESKIEIHNLKNDFYKCK